MSSGDDISLSRYFKTISNETRFPSIEMPLRQLFESPGLSTPASLSCFRGYYSNMALGIVKGSIGCFRSKLSDLACLITKICNQTGQIGQFSSPLEYF